MPKDPTFENALSFARDLVRIPSPSGEEESVAQRVREEMEELRFSGIRVDEVGNVVGIIPGTGGAPPVLLNCHLDVVAEGDPEEWEYPPFSGVVEGGCLHGRGAMDIKGPLALQTYAAAALAERAPGDVIVAHTVFEERGGWGLEHLLRSGTVEPGAVIIGESTHGDVTIGHRGRAELEVVIHGLAGHASAPGRSRNALDLLPGVLGAVEDLSGDQPANPVLGPSTLVATGIEVLPESRNVIPDRALVVVDWRTLPGDTEESLVGCLQEAVGQRIPQVPEGLRIEVRVAREEQWSYTGERTVRRVFSPGFLMDEDDPLVEAAARAVGKRGGGGRSGHGAALDLRHRRWVELRNSRNSHRGIRPGGGALRPHEPGAAGHRGGSLGVRQVSPAGSRHSGSAGRILAVGANRPPGDRGIGAVHSPWRFNR